ncbi:MAG: sugar transferase [Ruminococcaceae bacterium]|nr:sugar transferase [Oscillospiraceae bacterium]
MYKHFFKRFFDILLSGLALIILSPIMLIIALSVWIFMGSPILFKQARTTKDGRIFYIKKFRTMKDTRDKDGNLLSEEERKCKFGNFLRGTSLDELPELWNIFVGDMSIIGPRPLHADYMPYYKDSEKDRNTVRGGLVPPEVLTKNLTPSWDEQLDIEGQYARNLTFILDLKIFFATFVVLFKRMKDDYGEYVRPTLIEEREQAMEEKEAVEKETVEKGEELNV